MWKDYNDLQRIVIAGLHDIIIITWSIGPDDHCAVLDQNHKEFAEETVGDKHILEKGKESCHGGNWATERIGKNKTAILS